MNSQHLYCVWAYRYGDKKSYNFPVGIFHTEEEAIKEAKIHHTFRGGKYGHCIHKMEIGKSYDAEECKPIIELLN